MASHDHCPVCGYAFQRAGEIAEAGGKCPGCGLLLQIPVAPKAAKAAPIEEGSVGLRPVAPRPTASPAPVSAKAPYRSIPWWGWTIAAGVSLGVLVMLGLYAAGERNGPPEVSVSLLQELQEPAPPKPGQPKASQPYRLSPEPLAPSPRPSALGAGLPTPPAERPKVSHDQPLKSSPPPQPEAAQIAKSLDDVPHAVVKFEVPVAGEARMQYGCGFLVDRRGWIATNHHVIAQATTAARATFADGTTCRLAGLVGDSPAHDLALVQLADPPQELTILDVSYDDTPRLGSRVYAFGHPFNADFSLSEGIVSRVLTTADLAAGPNPGLLSAMKAPSDLVWIQHDAKISPGNSGGPLLQEDGRVIGVNSFMNVKAEFGYASHVRYLRELLATASGQVTPLPAAAPLAETLGEGQAQVRPGQVVVSAGRMKQLFDAAAAFRWKPQTPAQYQTLADLARLMTLAKHLESMPQAVRAPPEEVANLVGFSDGLFRQMRTAGWGPEHLKALNAYAAERIQKPGEGVMLCGSVLESGKNALLLKIPDTGGYVLVPVSSEVSTSPRGTRWLVIAMVSPQTARIKTPDQPEEQRLPMLLTHYMLRVP